MQGEWVRYVQLRASRDSLTTRAARRSDAGQLSELSVDPHLATLPVGPHTWAIGGGKGGVGKSVITVNLAVALARQGRRCVVVDADLGGANLHTLLGVHKPHRSLTHFLNSEVGKLSEILCETPFPNLWLISGAGAPLEMANPKYSQKQKILRHLGQLDVDHILLDLGAGSSFNVLDFFIEAQHQILVVVPEPTSIENTYHFLKAAFYRWLRKAARQSTVRSAITEALGENAKRRSRSPRELIDAVSRVDPTAGEALRERARAFSPLLVVNQSREAQDRRVGWEISKACRDYLDTEVRYLGDLQRDDCVLQSVSQKQPVLHLAPHSVFARDVEVIVEHMLGVEENEDDEGEASLSPTLDPDCPLYDENSLAVHGLMSDDERRAHIQAVWTRSRGGVQRAPARRLEAASDQPKRA